MVIVNDNKRSLARSVILHKIVFIEGSQTGIVEIHKPFFYLTSIKISLAILHQCTNCSLFTGLHEGQILTFFVS